MPPAHSIANRAVVLPGQFMIPASPGAYLQFYCQRRWLTKLLRTITGLAAITNPSFPPRYMVLCTFLIQGRGRAPARSSQELVERDR
jgi:hypothetical protein